MKPALHPRILLLPIAVLGLLTLSSPWVIAGGTMTRASVDVDGGDSDGSSADPAISGSGRFVAFASSATDLIAGDQNELDDIFVHDLILGTTRRASVAFDGADPNGTSMTPVLGAGGRYVAYLSWASDLVPGDDNGLADTFVYDMVSGTTVLAGPDSPIDSVDDEEYGPSISGTGRYVAFVSSSQLVPPDDNDDLDVFVIDLVTGEVRLASVAVDGGAGNADSISPSISRNGRYVAFLSSASNLIPDDGNGVDDLFVRDMLEQTTVRASVAMDGGDPNGKTLIRPSISADGQHVAFASQASDLVPGDDNGILDVYVRHLATETTVRASIDRSGGDPNGVSQSVSLSQDGRYVAFRSDASDLVTGDDNGLADIFRRDLSAGTTTRVSVDTQGDDPNDNAWNPSIDFSGGSVAFVSFASDLVPDDGNGLRDVFVRTLS